MEKYGIEKEDEKKEDSKEASEKCAHPQECLVEEDGAVFCKKCRKYIGVKND